MATFLKPLSRLNGHPNRNKVPGIEASTGPLGHGLPIAVGHALSAKLDVSHRRTYVTYVEVFQMGSENFHHRKASTPPGSDARPRTTPSAGKSRVAVRVIRLDEHRLRRTMPSVRAEAVRAAATVSAISAAVATDAESPGRFTMPLLSRLSGHLSVNPSPPPSITTALPTLTPATPRPDRVSAAGLVEGHPLPQVDRADGWSRPRPTPVYALTLDRPDRAPDPQHCVGRRRTLSNTFGADHGSWHRDSAPGKPCGDAVLFVRLSDGRSPLQFADQPGQGTSAHRSSVPQSKR